MVGGHAALMRLRGRYSYVIYLLPLIFLALFYFYPLLAILDLGLRPDGWLDLSAFLRLFSTDYYIGTLLFTVYQAALSTALTLLLALPCAYVFSRYRFAGKSLLLSLATLPFVLPTVVVAMAFMSLIGKRGLVNDLLVTLVFAGLHANSIGTNPGDRNHRACLLQLRHRVKNHDQLLVVLGNRG